MAKKTGGVRNYARYTKTYIFMQGTKAMTREYVEGQLDLFKAKSPRQAREKLEYVYVVGMNGNVHKHEL